MLQMMAGEVFLHRQSVGVDVPRALVRHPEQHGYRPLDCKPIHVDVCVISECLKGFGQHVAWTRISLLDVNQWYHQNLRQS